MTVPVTLSDVTTFQNDTSATTTVNDNTALITSAFGSSLDTSGDQMRGTLDMNSNQIINLPAPGTLESPLRVQDLMNSTGNTINVSTVTNNYTTTYSPGVLAYNASGSNLATTGSIGSGSSTLVLSSALDFKNNQGIRINNAGPAYIYGPPTGIVVTPTGTAGSTTYSYKISSYDANGGIGAATGVVSTTTGNAILSCVNYNLISWTAGTGSPIGYAVYKLISGNYTFVGMCATNYFYDYGQEFGNPTPPDWIPALAPSSAMNDWMITTISSGAGTTTLTLASASSNAATSVNVTHDDTTALQNAINAVTANNLGVYIPAGNYNFQALTLPYLEGFTFHGDGLATVLYQFGTGIAWPIRATGLDPYPKELTGFTIVGSYGTATSIRCSFNSSMRIHNIYLYGIPGGCSGLLIDGNPYDNSVTHDNRISYIRYDQYNTLFPALSAIFYSGLASDSSIDDVIGNGVISARPTSYLQYGLYCGSGAQTLTVQNTHFYNHAVNVIYVEGGGGQFFKFADNYIDSSVSHNVVVNDCSYCQFENNYFNLQPFGCDGLVFQTTTNCLIVNSLFSATESGTNNGTQISFDVASTGNTVGGFKSFGNFTTNFSGAVW